VIALDMFWEASISFGFGTRCWVLVPFADNFIRPVHYSVMVWPQIMFMVEILAFLLAYYSFVIATGFASSCED
jgi:hypothetical protein